jgi:hypothetical protein
MEEKEEIERMVSEIFSAAGTVAEGEVKGGLRRLATIQKEHRGRNEASRLYTIERAYHRLVEEEWESRPNGAEEVAGWFVMTLWRLDYDHNAQECLECGALFPPYRGTCPECGTADVGVARYQRTITPHATVRMVLNYMEGAEEERVWVANACGHILNVTGENPDERTLVKENR